MALKTLNVVYGFTSETIEKSITKEIMLRGYKVNSTMRTTKDLIKEFVKSHKEVDVVILKEYLDGGGKYSPIELTELVDDVKDVNVVIVLATNHRGKNEMRELYSAGIYNAFFSDGKFGANPDKIADLACNGRTRREAREYYKINETIPDHINITYEEYREYYRFLLDKSQGLNLIDRFVTISHMLYPGQMGGFIDALPEDVISLLLKYEEFYPIANKIYSLGYSKQKYKKGKGVEQGITKEKINKKMKMDARRRPDKHVELTPADVRVKGKVERDIEAAAVEYENEQAAADGGFYDEPFEEEREPQQAPSKKAKAPKAQKKGLFGRKKKEDSDSLFEQNSDVDFSDVGGEPISADDDWGYGEGEPESEVSFPSGGGDIYENVTAPDFEIEPLEEPEHVSESEPPVPKTSPEPTPNTETTHGEIPDYANMSADELMKLLEKN